MLSCLLYIFYFFTTTLNGSINIEGKFFITSVSVCTFLAILFVIYYSYNLTGNASLTQDLKTKRFHSTAFTTYVIVLEQTTYS